MIENNVSTDIYKWFTGRSNQ